MKKHILKRQNNIALLCSALLLNISCVNQIGEKLSPGTTPISFSTKVTDSSTRVTNTAFEQGDKVGLFAMLSSTSISGNRYIDNIWLECDDAATLIPEKTVFYPEGDATLDFVSYYPYQETGIAAKHSSINVSVKTDQSSKENYSLSDFVVATASNIKSSTKAIELEYQHKFIKLQLVLTPEEGEDSKDMLKANPQVTVTGFKTKASYDFETNSFSDLDEEADITPYGSWSLNKEGNLVGKEVLVIPQTASSATQAVIIDWNGTLYTCPIPTLETEKYHAYQIEIAAKQSENRTLKGIASSITDWDAATGEKTEDSNMMTTVHLASLSFAQSDIYRIYHEGKPITEICKEYLKSQEINSRAIIAYPIKENEKADLSQGTILKLLDSDAPICGGTISWKSGTTFSYIQGSDKAIPIFSLDQSGKIISGKTDVPLSINVTSYCIRDIRGGVLQTYPIVKIGTQYWMKENLHATTYENGTSIPKCTELGTGAGYFKPDKVDTYFYNGEAVLAGNLAPEKWKIPNINDWKQLQAYITEDASLLKAGNWIAFTTDSPSCPATGESGLEITPQGLYNKKEQTKYTNLGRSAAYWISGEKNSTLSEQAALFMSNSNALELTNCNPEKQALSIRCIKE